MKGAIACVIAGRRDCASDGRAAARRAKIVFVPRIDLDAASAARLKTISPIRARFVAPEDFAKLPPASEMEEDLLDLAAGVTRYSRLACQIWLGEALDSLTVRIPGEAHNMQGR